MSEVIKFTPKPLDNPPVPVSPAAGDALVAADLRRAVHAELVRQGLASASSNSIFFAVKEGNIDGFALVKAIMERI